MTPKAHVIGIGGIGMSAVARLLIENGWEVTGSDRREGIVLPGITPFVGHRACQVPPDSIVVYSSAVQADNPEMLAPCLRRLHRSDMLRDLARGKRVLTVSGTHGKTTTSAMLAWVLEELGEAPSYALGGLLKGINAKVGSGPWFVVEGDESDGSFARMDPEAAILTNLEAEHLDYWQTEERLVEAFREFAQRVPGLYWWKGDARLQQICTHGTAYEESNLQLQLPGAHNRLNAQAVYHLVCDLGFDPDAVREALASFPGVARRLECKGEPRGIRVIDDYAHHPTEVKATLGALRESLGERRIIAVLQPHRYSRVRDCLGLWGEATRAADRLIVTEVFAAGEGPNGVTHDDIIAECGGEHLLRSDVAKQLAGELEEGDVVVTLGAGDITRTSDELVGRLS